MTFLNISHIVGCNMFIDDHTMDIWTGCYGGYSTIYPTRKLTGCVSKMNRRFNGFDGDKKKSFSHDYIVVKMFIDKDYNPNTHKIVHIDGDRLNVMIDNLKIVPKKSATKLN